MNQKQYFFDGTMTAVSPVTYSIPGGDGKLPVIGGNLYIPSSALRGKLRRLARDIIVDETGRKLPFDDFFFMTLGGLFNTKNKKENRKEAEGGENGEAEKAENATANESYAIEYYREAERINPFISLFGSGPGSPVGIPAKLHVMHAIANRRDADNVHPVRCDDARRDPAITMEIVDESFFEEYMERAGAQRSKSLLNKEIEEISKSIRALRKKGGNQDEIDELEKRRKDLDAKKNDITEVSISHPGLDYEVIPSGAVMGVSMRIIRASDVEAALLLKAIERFAYNPVIGGRVAAGNGVVSGEMRVKVREKPASPPVEIGVISWKGDFSGLEVQGEKVQALLDYAIPFAEYDFSYKRLASAVQGV